MVVGEDYGTRAGGDSRCEYLAGLDRYMGYRAHGNRFDGDQPKPNIQQQHGQGFAVARPEPTQLRERLARCGDRGPR